MKYLGFIPEGAEWYLAEIVERITVEDDNRDELEIATVLIKASTPEELNSLLSKKEDLGVFRPIEPQD